jgi:hypothetical protein
MKNKNFQILEISTFLRIVCSMLPVSLDCLFLIGPSVYSFIYSASFDQIYLITIKDISSKSIDILSKAINNKKQMNKIYRDFYHCIIYIANEGRHVRINNIYTYIWTHPF